MRSRRRPDAGLSLVELMITLAVASLVSGSTFVFFAGQQKVYETQGRLLNVQQNLWSAMEIMGRNVRAAGIGMANCVRQDSDRGGPDNGDPPPTPSIGFPNPAGGVRAFRGGAVIRIPPMWIINGAAGAPDEITVAFGTNTFGNTADTFLTQDVRTTNVVSDAVMTIGTVYQANDFILLADVGTPARNLNNDRGCTLFQVTGVLGNQLLHAPTSAWNPPGDIAGLAPTAVPAAGPAYVYPTGDKGGVRNFGTLNWVRFFIDATGAPATPPRLMMDRLDTNAGPQLLADGIEDMQIAYACDIPVPLAPDCPAGPPCVSPETPTNPADGTLTEGGPLPSPPAAGAQPTVVATRLYTAPGTGDEWTYNTPGDIPRPDCNRPTAVRVTLIGRSMTADTAIPNGAGNYKPGIEDGLAGPVDTFRHRVITSTINPRNRE